MVAAPNSQRPLQVFWEIIQEQIAAWEKQRGRPCGENDKLSIPLTCLPSRYLRTAPLILYRAHVAEILRIADAIPNFDGIAYSTAAEAYAVLLAADSDFSEGFVDRPFGAVMIRLLHLLAEVLGDDIHQVPPHVTKTELATLCAEIKGHEHSRSFELIEQALRLASVSTRESAQVVAMFLTPITDQSAMSPAVLSPLQLLVPQVN